MTRSATLLLIAASLCAADLPAPASATAAALRPAGPASVGAMRPAAAVATPLKLQESVAMSALVAGVKLADLSRSSAEQGVRIQRAGLLPQVGVEGTASRYAASVSSPADVEPIQVGPYNRFDGRVRAGQALLDLSSWYGTDAAKADVRSATAAQRQSLEAAAVNAALRYVAVARAAALVEARRLDLKLADELAVLAEAQVKAGVAEPINATRAQTQVSAARGDVLVAENRESQAHIDLARAIELDLAQRFALATAFDGTMCATEAPRDIEQAVAQAVTRRPELQSATAAIESAQSRLSAIRGERWGNAQLVGEAGRTGPALHDTGANWSFGVQYTIPVFDGLRREGRIEAQDIAARSALVSRDDLRIQVAAEARSAVLDLLTGEQYWSVARERVALAEKELGQARDRFRVGVASNLDVIAAQQSLSQALDAEIQARASLATSRARLAHAVGSATALK
ncbi:MAG: TolC family protein [Planctomycetes bacterium]|nr:TolC family protein [Planctomycetota bacterium]